MSKVDIQRKVGEMVRKNRQRRGLLQKDFVQHGYSLRHYQKIEKGDLNLTLKTLDKLAQALDVSVADLIADKSGGNEAYRSVVDQSPFGIIMWELVDLDDPYSLRLYDHNQYGAHAVYRNLGQSKGKSILDIFPLADEQGLVKIFFEVIKTGKAIYTPELIRHDENFPFTVFSTKFVRCSEKIAAAIFTDITEEFLAKRESESQKEQIAQLQSLPMGEDDRILQLKKEVNRLHLQLGLRKKYLLQE